MPNSARLVLHWMLEIDIDGTDLPTIGADLSSISGSDQPNR